MMRHGTVFIANGDVEMKYTGSFEYGDGVLSVRYREESGEVRIVAGNGSASIVRRNSIVPELSIEIGKHHGSAIVVREGTIPFETLGESIEITEDGDTITAVMTYQMIQGSSTMDRVTFSVRVKEYHNKAK